MRITKVEARNFRSYTSIDWNLVDIGLILVDGVNLETGRSNMTGKTTLLDSVFWGLYGWLPKWGGPKGGPVDAVIKRGEKRCQVQVNLECGGKQILIRRERPSKLYVEIDGKEVEGKSDDLNSRIPGLVGLTPNQFLLSVYMSQGRTSSFFTMSDTERTQVLSVVAGLEHLNSALVEVKEKLKSSETREAVAVGQVSLLEEQVAALPGKRMALEDAVTAAAQVQTRVNRELEQAVAADKTEGQLEDAELATLLAVANSQYSGLAEKLSDDFKKLSDERAVLAQAVGQAPQVEQALIQSLSDAQAGLRAVESSRSEADRQEWENDRLKEKIKREIELAEQSASGKCGHCSQSLPEWDRNSKMKAHIDRAEALQAQIKPIPTVADPAPYIEAVNAARDALVRRQTELSAEPARLRAAMQAIDGSLAAVASERRNAELKHQTETKAYSARFQGLQRERWHAINTLKEQCRIATIGSADVCRQLEKFDEIAAGIAERLKELKATVAGARSEIDELLDLQDLFGPKGLRVLYFDDIIARISARAGEFLSLMTDGIYSTRIDQTAENGKGETKLVLKPVITKGGLEVPLDDLSGGALKMAMLAYDVSVSEAVADSNLLFLDETLDGLDAQGKAQAMQLLEAVGRTRAVYLIDHTSEIKAAVNKVIQVRYAQGGSELASEPL